MNYAGINLTDIANGTGVRVSLFVSGCRNHCRGCFNQKTWDFNYGKPFTMDTVDTILNQLDKDYTAGVSILGGDPFEPENIDAVTWLLYVCKHAHQNKSVWVYTGYHYEDFADDEIMNYIDVLVDGPFVLEQRDITLAYRGSSNQRLIDVKETKEKGDVVLYEPTFYPDC